MRTTLIASFSIAAGFLIGSILLRRDRELKSKLDRHRKLEGGERFRNMLLREYCRF